MDVSIIIVNYNTCRLTINAIDSVKRSMTKYRYEVILVDNHSTDHSVKSIKAKHQDIKLIENDQNVGFAVANNQAMKMATGRYILLLNSDTEIRPDTLEVMLEYMDQRPNIGASGCKVLLPNGNLDKACRRGFPTPSASFYYLFGLSKRFPNNPKFTQYHLEHLSHEKEHPVDSLVGAFMLVRRKAIDEVGLLDENFFMYGEDIDWCYRIKQAGWDIYYYPETSIIHYKGASSSKRKPFKLIYEFHRAMFLFHKKHYQKHYSIFVNFAVYSGIFVRLMISAVKNSLKHN